MSNTIVAKRYANALFEIAKEKQTLGTTAEEARAVKGAILASPDLLAFLKHPKIGMAQKMQVLEEAFSTVSADTCNTLKLMVERQRTDEIAEMASELVELINEEQSVADAKAYTTRPLTDAEREAISSVFAPKVGKQSLRIENIVDSTLIGGLKLRIGNRIFDGSIQGKLNRLERQLLTQQS